MQVLQELSRSTMSSYQKIVVGMALALIIIDGIDVSLMAYSAPLLSREWEIDSVTLGFLLSASLFGMAGGAILLTPLADRIGRRRLTIIAFTIASLGMVLSAVSIGPVSLLICRVIVGFGVGGMMANLIVLVSEYSSEKRRGTVLGIYAAGYPIGATLGGFVATPLLEHAGWRALFAAAAALSVALLVCCVRWLPESLHFLLTVRPKDALDDANRILRRMRRSTLDELPAASKSPTSTAAFREIVTSRVLIRTLLLWLAYACMSASYYFVNTWIPKIMSVVADSDRTGVTFGLLANAGGIAGCFTFSLLALKYSASRLLPSALFAAGLAYVAFGIAFQIIPIALVAAALIGVLSLLAISGFYAFAPTLYSPRARATGVGWMIGVGRLASISAPILVGVLLEAGRDPEDLFFIFAVPLILGAACVLAILLSVRRATSRIAVSGHAADEQLIGL